MNPKLVRSAPQRTVAKPLCKGQYANVDVRCQMSDVRYFCLVTLQLVPCTLYLDVCAVYLVPCICSLCLAPGGLCLVYVTFSLLDVSV